MDQLKLKLQEYYQRYQQMEQKVKPGKEEPAKEEVLDLENDILTQFGLPTSRRFVQILHDFVHHSQVSDQLLDYVSKKLRSAARKYLLAPVMSDVDLLEQARDQKRSPYDVLPELGYPAQEYALFLIGELYYRRNMAAADILEELKKMQHFHSWNDLALLSKMNNYSHHELYTKLKKHELRFIDDYIQHSRRQETARLVNKRPTPAEEGYKPDYKTITKVQVEDIIFDEHTTPSLFGKIKSGRGYTRITIGLEFSELNQILMSSDELGVEISNHIKKRLANPAAEKPTVIDIRAEFGDVLKLDNCYLEVYKPQHREGNKWVEDKDNFYFVDKILTKKEYEKRTKEAEVQRKIQECLELIGGSYVYYQRLRRLGITDDEAKLRAGLQDELLFKLSFFLNKVKE
ncbi:hypothetical protein HF324_00860 [Chitinophaga oryzae]|uniref:Uncharacterized protein n=1 Tax=Chitinophaga oryzae TaxID=2725414 RepID=A0AAE6ZBN9_9BACT|nr:hypothetical protein [Chitinophaga oryzae]QJB29988.1 hypothetical protein HF329_01155 [Chitinophaga oryzae]QJB36485.1 hypothetical protein HF324_00860 [Chitinophaga oryzae]